MTKMSDLSVMLFPWGAKKPDAGEIIAATQLAEDLGFYSVTLPTHMTRPSGWLFESFRNADVLDALAVVPALAASTKSIKIGFNSALLPLLPPYQWAKYLSTLDVISNGRLIVGVAMGWWEEDFTAVDVPLKKRGKLFDEQLEVVTRLMTEDRVTFNGDHYQIADMPLEPKPLQQPHPPIWIGGGLISAWRAARYGECLLAFWPDEEETRDIWLPKLKEEGDKYGSDPKLADFTFVYVADSERDYEKYFPLLKKGVAFEEPNVDPRKVTISGSPEQCAERLHALHDAGVWHFVLEFQFHGIEDVTFGMKHMEKFAERVGPLLDG